MAKQIIELHNALHLAASGIQPNIPLHMQPAMLNTMNSFIDGIYSKCMIKCTICMQRWFLDKWDGVNLNYLCATCVEEKKISDRNNDVNFVASMSAANNMNPFFHVDQIALYQLNHSLNSQEQALIAISTPIMSIFSLKGPKEGQNVGYKGNVINIAQDLTQICLLLPRLPANCNIFKVRSVRGTDPGNFKDFTVRKQRVYRWLLFLKKWNPAYKHIVISNDNLNALPDDNSVYPLLRELVIPNNVQNHDNVNQDIAYIPDDDDDNDVDGIMDGPIPNELENAILETGIALDVPNIDEANAIINEIIHPPLNNALVEWPQLAPAPYDEYNTPYLLTSAFPCLFPFGNGDVTDQIRNIAVSLHDASIHYLKYSRTDCNGIEIYPFASDARFCHYIQDMDERHRIQSQASVYLQKNPADAAITIGELRDMARNINDPSLFAANLRMQRYAANILGSSQYMSLRKKELIALMSAHKIATQGIGPSIIPSTSLSSSSSGI